MSLFKKRMLWRLPTGRFSWLWAMEFVLIGVLVFIILVSVYLWF
ncbi:hypothetical protein [Xanthocytophaga flava]|nr:hypothetical protein [Xanthocytophaga flavus]MDJ1473329.1 hypothetical protein [Xanthocytophaga flavus]